MTRRTMLSIRRTAASIALSLLLAACSSRAEDTLMLPAFPSVALPMGADVVLAPGEYVTINPGGLRLTFVSVTSDSRCPTNVQCIQAGSARVSVVATTTAGARDVPLETTVRDTATVDRYLVQLVTVAPVPVTTTVIPASSYRATLRVTNK